MRNTLFIGVIFCTSFAVLADQVCNVPFFNNKILKVEERTSGSNVEFEFGKERLKVAGTCKDLRRIVEVQSFGKFEIIAEHFVSGSVRQYVVKLCGNDLGMIKIERAAHGQPRLSLTDRFGRILGEIANADNEADSFVLRDSSGHILAHAKKSSDSWTVDSGSIHPLLASGLLFASRMERSACELVAANSLWIQGLVVGIFGGIVVAAVVLYKPALLCRAVGLRVGAPMAS